MVEDQIHYNFMAYQFVVATNEMPCKEKAYMTAEKSTRMLVDVAYSDSSEVANQNLVMAP